MALNIRRVVTGHDENGKAVVLYDGIADTIRRGRPNHEGCVIWTTDRSPADNNGSDDEAKREVGTTHPTGSVFRVVEYGPGVTPRNHRTDSIDYAVVMAGEIDMELDDGLVVHLKAGDVLVQRGTIHNWVNNGTEPCVIAFSLLTAEPVSVGGKPLDAIG